MTATVVDELLIKLGFDTAALTGSASKVENVIDQMGRRIGGILGAVFSVDYLKNLITDTANMGTKMSVLSKMTGEGVEKLQGFQQAVIRMGGTAEGFNGTITKLKDAIQDVAVTGGTGVGGLLAAVGISGRDASGHIKKVSQVMMELSDVFKRSDNTHAQFLQRQFGIDDNTFLAMKEGSKVLNTNIELMIKQGVMTEASAKQQMMLKQRLDDLNQSWGKMRYNVADRILPTMYDLTNVLMKFGSDVVPKVANAIGAIQDKLGISNKAMIDFLAAVTLGLGAITTINLIGFAFKGLATTILGVGTALGGVTTSLGGMVAIVSEIAAPVLAVYAAYKGFDQLYNKKNTSEMYSHGINIGGKTGTGDANVSADNQYQTQKNTYKPSNLLPKAFADNLDATAYAHMMKESGGDPSKIGYAMYRSGDKWQYKKDAHGNKIPEAYGLFQLKPETASEALGRKVTGQQLIDDPQLSLQARNAYLKKGYAATGSEAGAYAYYNGGPGGGEFYKKHGHSRYDYSESILNNAKRAPINNTALAAKTPQLTQAQNTENNTTQSSNTHIDNLNVHGVKDLDGIIKDSKKYNDPYNLTRATNNFQGGLSS